MNVERMKRLRDAIAESESYYQESYFHYDSRGPHPCGSPACLAGHAVLLAIEADTRPEGYYADMGLLGGVEDDASFWLDLDPCESARMFESCPLWGKSGATKEEALDMLDRAIETGVIEWKEAWRNQ